MIFDPYNEESSCRVLHTALSGKTEAGFEDVVVSLMHLRNPRGGYGRADLFSVLLHELYTVEPDLAMSILPLIPEYGCWSDMFHIAAAYPQFKHAIFTIAERQLVTDEIRYAGGQPVSIFAKWVPDEKKTLGALAVEFAHYLMRNMPAVHSQIMRLYRKRINRLNAAINPVEIYECAGKYDQIDPATVAEGALRIKKDAYLNKVPGTEEPRSTDPARIACAEKFQEFFEERGRPAYEKLLTTSPVYDNVRRLVSEWSSGGWRV